jgi:hypothetical protein
VLGTVSLGSWIMDHYLKTAKQTSLNKFFGGSDKRKKPSKSFIKRDTDREYDLKFETARKIWYTFKTGKKYTDNLNLWRTPTISYLVVRRTTIFFFLFLTLGVSVVEMWRITVVCVSRVVWCMVWPKRATRLLARAVRHASNISRTGLKTSILYILTTEEN